MKGFRIFLSMVLVMVLVTVSVVANGTKESETQVLKISMGLSDKHPVYQALSEIFVPAVENGTDGRIVVELYPSAQLGDDTKAVEGLRAGTLEMCVTSTAPLTGLVPELAVFDIPFLFPSDDIADKVLGSKVGVYLSSLLPAKNLVNISWWEYGFRNLTNSKRPVYTPDDLKGLKIRTMANKYHLAAWEAMGANPTPMAWGEVFISLEQKAIDGQENPISTIYSSGVYEVNQYITITRHIYSPLMLLMSKPTYDAISDVDRAIIEKAAQETGKKVRELNRSQSLENIEAMKAAGATVIELSDENKKLFQDRTANVWNLIEKDIGADLIKMIRTEVANAK